MTDIFVGKDATSIASSSESAGGSKLEMYVLQTGANVAVTQLKSNNRDEGQLSFFSLLCCSVHEAGHSFKASSFLTLSQSKGERRKKVSFSHIHTGNSSFCFLYLDLKISGMKDCCLLYSVHCYLCMSWSSHLNLKHLANTFMYLRCFDILLTTWRVRASVTFLHAVFKIHVYLCMFSSYSVTF